MTKNNPYQKLISKLTEKKYHCIFLKLPINEIVLSSDSKNEYKIQLKKFHDLSPIIFNSLDDDGILWIVTDDLYSNGILKKISFDISSISRFCNMNRNSGGFTDDQDRTRRRLRCAEHTV